jgi:hypothetical protein
MSLELEEIVEIVRFCGRHGWTHRQVIDEFNENHP